MMWIYCLSGEIGETVITKSDHIIGNWYEDGHTFLFFDINADDIVTKLVAGDHTLQLIDQYNMTYKQWQGDNLKPFQLGRFLFYPPWEVVTTLPDQLPVILDPGIVFGDGSHPTTRDCLEAIEMVSRMETVETMLDLGTGTGILAVAAAKLGVSCVIAVDYTFLSAKTAHANTVLNGFTDTIIVVNGRAEDFVCVPTDLLVANIQYPVMRTLVASEQFLGSRWFVLSGLLQREAEEIVAILKRKPVRIHRCWQHGSLWQTILGEIRDNQQ